MKKFNFLIISCFAVMFFSTLEVSAQREVGISLNGFSDFGLVYKVQKAENKYLRYEFAYFDNSLQSREDRFNVFLNVGFSAGVEKRIAVTDKFLFIRGFLPGIDISGVYSRATNGFRTVSNGNLTLTPSLGYVLGGQYHISDKFYIGLEIIPSINGEINLNSNGAVAYNLNTNFNIDNIGLSAVYKFSVEN